MLPYQRRWVEDDSKLKIVVKARQIGYSFAATLRAVMKCLERKTTWIFLSKGERQSRLLMEKVHDHIRSCGIVARTNESTFFEGTSLKQLEVRFPNGSVIYGLPANPDTARGYSGHVTLDEFAFHADAGKIYAALFPTITRGYGLEVISTPNGTQGKFYELARAAGLVESGLAKIRPSDDRAIGPSPITRSSDRPIARLLPTAWSAHYCDVYDAVRQGLQVDINLLRNGCEDATAWQQEFCCQFVSTAENFFSPELLDACLSAEAGAGFQVSGARCQLAGLLPDTRHPKPDTCFYLGIDIGRRHDRTVFWLDEVQPAKPEIRNSKIAPASSSFEIPITNHNSQITNLSVARLVRTMDNAPFADQLAYARELMSQEDAAGRPLVRRCSIDATGIGAHMAETLAREFGPRVEPVVFTAAVKEDLAFRTKRRMEARLTVLPDTREIRRAFSAVKKFITPSGNLRFDAARTEAGHADEFWAKALADLAADPDAHRAAARAEDAFLADSLPIVNPLAFREVQASWSALEVL
ncbi:MAG: terminase large subunit domain-containing protein [Terriglobia bacterium]